MSIQSTNVDVPTPKVTNDNVIDNPLLTREGIPVNHDNFYDSTDQIVNSTSVNDLRYAGNDTIWSVNPNTFVGSGTDSGLNGIDVQNSNNGKFDLAGFNKAFDRQKEIAKESQRLNDLNKLSEMSRVETKVTPHNLPIGQIAMNTKDTWFDLLDELLDGEINSTTFTKDNRLFYIGITILFFSIITYLYVMILNNKSNANNDNNVKKVYHIYQQCKK
jgi:hypothetical protein